MSHPKPKHDLGEIGTALQALEAAGALRNSSSPVEVTDPTLAAARLRYREDVESRYRRSFAELAQMTSNPTPMKPSTKPYRMTVQELLELHRTTSDECREIMKRKNSDYTGGQTVDDPFANFNMAETFGIDPVLGILLRIGDKMRRIQSFARDGGLKVAGESVMDACNDIVNYAILIKGMCVERGKRAALQAQYGTEVPVRITDLENYGPAEAAGPHGLE